MNFLSTILAGRRNKPKKRTVLSSHARPASFSCGYNAVSPSHSGLRKSVNIETSGEDGMLSSHNRQKAIAAHRNLMRNSPMRVAMDQQIRVNVVGACGGKMYASFPDGFKDAANEVMRYFNGDWFPRAEFTFRQDFNWLLKTCLTSLDSNGNLILVFDDGILTGGNGTGRIRAFEGDEIADVPELSKYYPKSYKQSQGFVYNSMGMFCGAFVSTSQRGKTVFEPGKGVLKLTCDPFDDGMDCNWTCLGDMVRFNQGRGISPMTSALATLIDLNETAENEALAAKLNSKMVGQILRDASADEDGPVDTGAFDDEDGGVDSGEDVEVADMVNLRENGIAYQAMPKGYRTELFDTKHPNQAMPQFLDFLSGVAGGTRGMARVYSTLKAETSYTAFRGEQVITWPTFEELQKRLERSVCDWAARCVIRRAVKMGIIKNALPDGWERMIAWTWPKMREVSEIDAQNALAKKLSNGVTSFTREMGPGEFEAVMAERIKEKKLFDEAGLIYPGEESVSGQIKESAPEGDANQPKEEGGDNADQ